MSQEQRKTFERELTTEDLKELSGGAKASLRAISASLRGSSASLRAISASLRGRSASLR